MAEREKIKDILTERYNNKDIESRLDKKRFQSLFDAAVRDYFPVLKNKYDGQSIYGISFEIGGVVQKVYYESFETYVYLNTEEMYRESIEDCDEEEKDYYRFEPWAEWNVCGVQTELFHELKDYLDQNSLYFCCDPAAGCKELQEEVSAWYEEKVSEFEEAFEEECGLIRMWMAEVLGRLRNEGFWEAQGVPGIYVLPFSGECDIDTEELIETYEIMDWGCHGTEYQDYLETCE